MTPGARVTVVGAGTMGHGIAQAAAQAGFEVVLVDSSLPALHRAFEQIHRNLQGAVERGKLTADERAATLGRVHARMELAAAVAGSPMIIEAVPERLELKTELLSAVERSAPGDAILASNTSSLSITSLQRALERPARVVGLHFFNPVHLMKLVEVVRGEMTSPGVVDEATAFARALGKEPIVVRDSPGFASSRLGVALGLEAMRMLEEDVASAEDIDRAMELGYRHPMGPLRLTDVVGLDVRLDIAEHLRQALGSERFEPPAILRRLVAEGKLGRKTGQGFYRWSAEEGA